jgi:hypothetical protein
MAPLCILKVYGSILSIENFFSLGGNHSFPEWRRKERNKIQQHFFYGVEIISVPYANLARTHFYYRPG